MEIELWPSSAGQFTGRQNARIVWLPASLSPVVDKPQQVYDAVALHDGLASERDEAAYRYRVDLIIGKAGPSGAIQLLASMKGKPDQPREETLRHWNDHDPLRSRFITRQCNIVSSSSSSG